MKIWCHCALGGELVPLFYCSSCVLNLTNACPSLVAIQIILWHKRVSDNLTTFFVTNRCILLQFGVAVEKCLSYLAPGALSEQFLYFSLFCNVGVKCTIANKNYKLCVMSS